MWNSFCWGHPNNDDCHISALLHACDDSEDDVEKRVPCSNNNSLSIMNLEVVVEETSMNF